MYAKYDLAECPIIGLEELDGEIPRDVSIGIVGIGGAGCNSLNSLTVMGVNEATTIGINTDLQHLKSTKADKRVLLGHKKTKGRGAGGDAALAQQCAEEDQETLAKVLEGLDLIFITAGLGGGTGTGVAPVVARVARKLGAMVFATVTLPFKTEGTHRQKLAASGLNRLSSFCDCLIPLPNDKLHTLVPNYSLHDAFEVMDDLISQMIKSVVEVITQPSDVNVDFNDLKTILGRAGEAMILYGHSLSREPAKIINKVLHNPLVNISPDGGQAALIHVTCGSNFTLHDCEEVMKGLKAHLSEEALIIRGNRILDEPTDEVKVVAVVAGLPVVATEAGAKPPLGSLALGRKVEPSVAAEVTTYQTPAPPGSDRHEVPWIL